MTNSDDAEFPVRPAWNPNLPVVSVITPTYNYGHFLEKCIRSVLTQTYPNIEYIIVDGSSEDNTLELIKRYEKKGITKWVSEKDDGQTDAINKGFSMTTGHLFTWLNADDAFAHNGVLEEVVKHFQEGHSFIVGEIAMIDTGGRIIEEMTTHSRSVPVTYADYLHYWKYPALPQPSVFVARSIAATAFPLSVDLFTIMDYEYFLRCLKENPKSIWVSTVWVHFLIHERNKTSANVQAGRNTDLEYDRVFHEESRYLSTQNQKHYLRELDAFIVLRNLARQFEFNEKPGLLKLLKCGRKHPDNLKEPLFWKLLFRRLMGNFLYNKLLGK